MPMVDVGVAMSVAGAFGDAPVELEDTCTHIGKRSATALSASVSKTVYTNCNILQYMTIARRPLL